MWLQNCRLFSIHNILHLFCAATFEDVKESPGALSVISRSQGTFLCHYQKGIMLQIYYPATGCKWTFCKGSSKYFFQGQTLIVPANQYLNAVMSEILVERIFGGLL